MTENRVISLGKRAEDEEKPFFEQLLQEGARKLLQAAIKNEIIEYIQFGLEPSHSLAKTFLQDLARAQPTLKEAGPVESRTIDIRDKPCARKLCRSAPTCRLRRVALMVREHDRGC